MSHQLDGNLSFIVPRFVDVAYMGPTIARKLVKAFYIHADTSQCFKASGPASIKRLVCDDVFNLGMRPATLLRALTVSFDLDNLNGPSDLQPDAELIRGLYSTCTKLSRRKTSN